MNEKGIITIKSAHTFASTVAMLQQQIDSLDLILFSKIDHAQGAAKVGKELRPTLLLVYGHPKAGTPLMEENQLAGLDLPLKTLIWEDAQQNVWLSYNDMKSLGERYDLAGNPTLSTLAGALEKINHAAAN